MPPRLPHGAAAKRAAWSSRAAWRQYNRRRARTSRGVATSESSRPAQYATGRGACRVSGEVTFFLVKKSQAAPGKRKSSATWSKNRRLAALHVANPAASGGIQPAPSPSQPFAAVRGTLHALLTTSPGAPCERVLLQPCSGPASPSARPKTNRRHSFLPCNYPTASQDTQPNFRSASTSKSAACCISPACSFLRSPLSFVIPQPRRSVKAPRTGTPKARPQQT